MEAPSSANLRATTKATARYGIPGIAAAIALGFTRTLWEHAVLGWIDDAIGKQVEKIEPLKTLLSQPWLLAIVVVAVWATWIIVLAHIKDTKALEGRAGDARHNADTTRTSAKANGTEHVTAVGELRQGDHSKVHIGNTFNYAGQQSPPEPPIDVSLTPGMAILPLEIGPGRIGYVLSLNRALLGSRSFYRIDNKSDDTPVRWPHAYFLLNSPQPFLGTRFDVKNHSDVNLAEIMIDLQLTYGEKFPPSSAHARSMIINHLARGHEFTFYVLNPCPLFVKMVFPRAVKAKVAGSTDMREFQLVHPANHGYCFDPNVVNFMSEKCG